MIKFMIFWRKSGGGGDAYHGMPQVIKLSRPTLFNSAVQPLCLPSLAPSLVNTTVSNL